jgi:hypothetical protein
MLGKGLKSFEMEHFGLSVFKPTDDGVEKWLTT